MWILPLRHRRGLKRARAALIAGSALKFVAQQQQASSEGLVSLEAAVMLLQQSLVASQRQIMQLSASSRMGSPQQGSQSARLEELADLHLDLQVLLLECMDDLLSRLRTSGQLEGRARELEAVRQSLMLQLQT